MWNKSAKQKRERQRTAERQLAMRSSLKLLFAANEERAANSSPAGRAWTSCLCVYFVVYISRLSRLKETAAGSEHLAAS